MDASIPRKLDSGSASMALILKGIVGGSVAMVVFFGAALPLFGLESTPVVEWVVGAAGAIVGAFLAARA
jgi:hypothetical protein